MQREWNRPMPVAHPSANPFRARRMIDAAGDHMLITLRCNLCRRTFHFWAEDLVKVVGADHLAHQAPFPCGRCKSWEYIDVRCWVPAADALNGLTVRRPVRQIVRWVWRNEKA